MTQSTPTSTPSATAWALIDTEKRRDRFIRRVSIVAWTLTFLSLAAFAVIIGLRVAQALRRAAVGVISNEEVFNAALPLLAVLGLLSLLIATLSTVGIFLRLRTASLTEIQLRLAALEELVADRHDEAPARKVR